MSLNTCKPDLMDVGLDNPISRGPTKPLALPFMIAFLKGVRVYNDAFLKKDPVARTKAIDASVKYGQVKDRAVYENTAWNQAVDPDGKLRIASQQEQQEYFLSTGTQTSRLDISQIVDGSFAEKAVARLGPYT
jgi:NitT/TauT family transport system substrate-binding protein